MYLPPFCHRHHYYYKYYYITIISIMNGVYNAWWIISSETTDRLSLRDALCIWKGTWPMCCWFSSDWTSVGVAPRIFRNNFARPKKTHIRMTGLEFECQSFPLSFCRLTSTLSTFSIIESNENPNEDRKKFQIINRALQ